MHNFNNIRMLAEDKINSPEAIYYPLNSDPLDRTEGSVKILVKGVLDETPGLPPYTFKEDANGTYTGANIVFPGSDKIYKSYAQIPIFIDELPLLSCNAGGDESSSIAAQNGYSIMSVHDVANKATTTQGDELASGFIRFRMFFPKPNTIKGRTLAGLLADAINKIFGFKAGSRISNTSRYPEGRVGGTLITSSGALIKIDDSVDAQAYNLDFQFNFYS